MLTGLICVINLNSKFMGIVVLKQTRGVDFFMIYSQFLKELFYKIYLDLVSQLGLKMIRIVCPFMVLKSRPSRQGN